MIYSVGSQVVCCKPVRGNGDRDLHPPGSVVVITKSPVDPQHPYRIRFPDGFETNIQHDHLVLLAQFKGGKVTDPQVAKSGDLFDRVIFRCVIGSRAFGLSREQSDTDRRGIYLPTAQQHWSLTGVPEQIENDATEEVYWELQKFIVLALKANPNLLECLYSPLVETMTPLGKQLVDQRDLFLSKLIYQTYNGYVLSQFKKIQTDLRNQGRIKWKHVMHLIRLLLSGIHVLQEGTILVDVGEHRSKLLSIRDGEIPWEAIESWRKELHEQFSQAYKETSLPERPDYERANDFLVLARRSALETELP